jgi:predicted GH43/DUF377 family glycosyl hydrolase
LRDTASALVAFFAVLSSFSAGCIQEAPSPWVGACAEYPDGTYDFGEIGIGTCLAAPADLRFLENGGQPVLAVSNSDAFRDFTSGSVLFIDWSSVDLRAGENFVSDLVTHAVETPLFPGTLGFVPSRNLLGVPTRISPEARTRIAADDMVFIDVADPMNAALANVTDDGSSLALGSDPFATAFDPSSGDLFVGNRTDHTVSVVESQADPIRLLDIASRGFLGSDRWFDNDLSGSKAAFSELEASDVSELTDDTWTLSWVEGTTRLWTPGSEGLLRFTTGGGEWVGNGIAELRPEDTDGVVEEVLDPYYYGSGTLGPRMLFADTSGLRGALPDTMSVAWVFDRRALLAPRDGEWDAELRGPCAVESSGLTWLFYDGAAAGGAPAIGLAVSDTGVDGFRRIGSGPILEPGGAHDAVGQADPFVVFDANADFWRMYYSAWDGKRWTIGEAWSDDLESWAADPEPVFAMEGQDVAAPAIGAINGHLLMVFARRDAGGTWTFDSATSFDGSRWTEVPLDLDTEILGADLERSPRAAVQTASSGTFRVEGEDKGVLSVHVTPGDIVEAEGWRVRAVAGELLDLPSKGPGSAGMAVSAFLPDLGLAWLDLANGDADATTPYSIGIADWDGVDLVADETPVLEAGPDGGFDQDGVSSPVVTRDGSAFVMFYAGHSGNVTEVGRATSTDGVTWTRAADPVLEVGSDWDSISLLPGSIESRDDGTLRLWYAGSDGVHWRIGAAVSDDAGQSFTRVEGSDGWLFGTGSPGDWDDSAVHAPFVIDQDGTLDLWYGGFDGTTWRIGFATSTDDGFTWTRGANDASDETPYVMQATTGRFDFSGVDRPVVWDDGEGFSAFYQGFDLALFRPGLAAGLLPNVFYKEPRMPTAGDTLRFVSRRNTEDLTAIPLDGAISEITTPFSGLSALYLDEDRGFLFAASKLLPYIVVLDIRDDSKFGFDDANYLGVEALVWVSTDATMSGFRSMLEVPGGDYLYALNDQPESVFILDLEKVVDDGVADVIWDALVGWLPAPRGVVRDAGQSNVMNIGPSSLALMPDGHTLYVSNFNANSVTAYDLRMGPWGQLVGEVDQVGENPDVLAISPDGHQAVVSTYEGSVDDNEVASHLAVIDVDPDSPTWLEVLTWIVNK